MTDHPIPDAAIDKHIAILGKTGSGKSNAAKTIAEKLMAAGERVCIIDPTGSWWGIRLDRVGKGASPFKPVIFGGEHRDLSIGPEHGAAMAEAIGTSSDSAIIDTREMRVGDRTKFFTAFAEGLLRSNRGPLTLIIDECHLFIPQGRVNDPQSGMMVNAGNNLISLGRGIGLRIILISQRPAKIHKDGLTQVETLVAMRLIAPQDRKAVDDWIGEWTDKSTGKEVLVSLPSLKTGEAWVWSPEIGMLERVLFPLASTFDSGKAPAAGDDVAALAPIDVAAIGARLDEIRQDALANDPARLKRRIAELEKAAGSTSTPAPKIIEAAETRGYKAGYATGRSDAARDLMLKFQEFVTESADAVPPVHVVPPQAGITEALRTIKQSRHVDGPLQVDDRLLGNTALDGSRVTVIDTLRPPAATMTPALQRALDAIAWWRAIGFSEASRDRAAIVAGLSPTASTFGVYLSKLREMSLVENGSPGYVRLTAAGLAVANMPESADPADVVEKAIDLLKPQAARVMRLLADAYPNPVERDALADAMGLSRTASTLGVYLSECGRLGFVENAGRGFVKAADFLFPEISI